MPLCGVCDPGLTPLLASGLCIFSDAGTLFLWIYWPSFNSASSFHGDSQHRAALNTYLSLVASVLTTVTVSSIIHKTGKLDMVSKGLWGEVQFLLSCPAHTSLCQAASRLAHPNLDAQSGLSLPNVLVLPTA